MYERMEKISNAELEDELQSSYIDYAMSVIIGRAIPDARDGLKPVQRRILYAMYRLNNVHSQPTKKSARVVGEVIGKFHPHGDIAIYDALARMAQEFSMNHTFVDGQGNFGSVDGDPPAAMRYTEVRLTRIAEEMIDDIDKETIEMIPNFDNTEKEPITLPGRVPNLLINGSSGIAVGVATSIPPHNLSEVCDAVAYYLDNENANVEELLSIIKGPDFPTGGVAVMSGEAYNGYKYGRGRLQLRAKAEIDGEAKQIVVTAIPFNVNKSMLIADIANLVKEKRIVGITDIRDESDKNGIRIVIELLNDATPENILNSLYKHTQLETTFPLINLAVVGNKLQSFNILRFINTFVDYRRNIVERRSRFELQVANDRMHIVDGLIVAINNIDAVVNDIRKSKETGEARGRLMSNYHLTEKQANAILDLRLGRLTQLEFDTLNSEKSELHNKIKYYSDVLADPKKLDGIIKEETLAIKRQYGRERRTEIIKTEEISEITEEDMISNERVSVIFTNTGYIKRMPEAYKEQARGGKGITAIGLKEGDFVKQILIANTKDYLVCISDKGRAYWLKTYLVPEASRYAEGKAIVNLLSLQDEKILKLLPIKEFGEYKVLFLTKKGLIKKVFAKSFERPRSTGVRAISLNENDSVADVQLYKDENRILIASRAGKAIMFEEGSIRFLGRAAMGVRGIRLGENDVAKAIIPVRDQGYILTITEKGYGKLTEVSRYRLQNRGGSGVLNLRISAKTGLVTKSMFVDKHSNITLISSNGIAITFKTESIRVTGRAASGVRLMKLQDDARVVDAKLSEQAPQQIS